MTAEELKHVVIKKIDKMVEKKSCECFNVMITFHQGGVRKLEFCTKETLK